MQRDTIIKKDTKFNVETGSPELEKLVSKTQTKASTHEKELIVSSTDFFFLMLMNLVLCTPEAPAKLLYV